jgi:hypothetical protein
MNKKGGLFGVESEEYRREKVGEEYDECTLHAHM